ncbi:hypothetical protein GUITHDRAFT_110549 [Guillardia theta CCMP2712]|uniref:Uncharacterized protein n=1 Tax=Guillardia theta (strain CCMP2712) TaxID=905079 RepID=L1J530_GUITC|nr:hypothetical protein GUITHDRAFT_110549 [Guillardia theta CCMP2712]EKX43427.1 hypothetical protein GUITHDRAFT_110549 [Guillardia theta CCMP2712]|eukprot:XP_005830407.1 hypothetical protein GUITHDRAFT_110549 [Guillardia theta CCMP2712]
MQGKGDKFMMQARDIQVIDNDCAVNVVFNLPQVHKDEKVSSPRRATYHPPPKRFLRSRPGSACMSDPGSDLSSMMRSSSATDLQQTRVDVNMPNRGMTRSCSDNILHALTGFGHDEEMSEYEKSIIARRMRNRQVGVQIAREESRPLARFITVHL